MAATITELLTEMCQAAIAKPLLAAGLSPTQIKMKRLKMWYARWFKVITNEQAKEWGLTHSRNVYGDEINHINCRSIWKDNKNRTYRVALLA